MRAAWLAGALFLSVLAACSPSETITHAMTS